MLVRSPSVLPEIEDMGITSPSRSFMQQRPAEYAIHRQFLAEGNASRLYTRTRSIPPLLAWAT
ncbi:MAG: hypothetical protein VB125_01535 [Burkholderia sp.]